jgi:hypothetical protein
MSENQVRAEAEWLFIIEFPAGDDPSGENRPEGCIIGSVFADRCKSF